MEIREIIIIAVFVISSIALTIDIQDINEHITELYMNEKTSGINELWLLEYHSKLMEVITDAIVFSIMTTIITLQSKGKGTNIKKWFKEQKN